MGSSEGQTRNVEVSFNEIKHSTYIKRKIKKSFVGARVRGERSEVLRLVCSSFDWVDRDLEGRRIARGVVHHECAVRGQKFENERICKRAHWSALHYSLHGSCMQYIL